MIKLSQWAKVLTLALCLNGCSDSIIRDNTSPKLSHTPPLVNEIKNLPSLEKILTPPQEIKNTLEENIWYPQPSTQLSFLSHHINQNNIEKEGHLYLADYPEFISNESTPRFGVNADNPEGTGNDQGIARQRLMYHIHYFQKEDGTLKTKILDVFPYRASRNGNGFRRDSYQTPTGFYVLEPQLLSYSGRGDEYVNRLKGFTGATILVLNILNLNGDPIYFETRGIHDPWEREVLIHGYHQEDYQINNERGSGGCFHVPSSEALRMAQEINARLNPLPPEELQEHQELNEEKLEIIQTYLFSSGTGPISWPNLEQEIYWQNLTLNYILPITLNL